MFIKPVARLTSFLSGRPCWLPVAVMLPVLAGCSLEGIAVEAGLGLTRLALEDRSLDHSISDTAIRAGINHNWFQANAELIARADFLIHEGYVILTGTVPDQAMRDQAESLAGNVPGIKRIYNEILIDPDPDPADLARNNIATTELEASLMLDEEVNALNYRVDTESGILYILGRAASPKEKQHVLAWARDIGGIHRLVDHIRLREGIPDKDEIPDKDQTTANPVLSGPGPFGEAAAESRAANRRPAPLSLQSAPPSRGPATGEQPQQEQRPLSLTDPWPASGTQAGHRSPPQAGGESRNRVERIPLPVPHEGGSGQQDERSPLPDRPGEQ